MRNTNSLKPICDCGGELYIYTEELHKLYRKINRDGRPSKRAIDINDGSTGVEERLHCWNCGAEFWFDEDKNGRIIKKDEYM